MMENETLRDCEPRCEARVRDNADLVEALNAHDRMPKMAPGTKCKMPNISPHVYAILGASHEFPIERSIADHQIHTKTRFDANHSKRDISFFNDVPSTFDFIERSIHGTCMTRTRDSLLEDESKSNYEARAAVSLRSSDSCPIDTKIDRGLTMLKSKPWKKVESPTNCRANEPPKDKEIRNDLITIKASSVLLRNSASRSTCEKLDFRQLQRPDRGSISSTSSWNLIGNDPGRKTIKYRNSIYLKSPVDSFALKSHEYRIVDIFVNNQIQALVQSVLEVLERVNPDKVQKILDASKDSNKIRHILGRSDIQYFVESLLQQPLVTSPKSFVISRATAIDEIDARLEATVANELIALTLEIPSSPCLELFVVEVRNNILSNLDKTISTTPDARDRQRNR